MSTDFRHTLRAIKASGQKVLVAGLGVSGFETALFLDRAGIGAVCIERQDAAQFRARSKFASRLAELEERGIPYHLGIDGEAVRGCLGGVGLAVISPGISFESAIVGALRHSGIPLVSELELGIEVLARPTVVVTGSNGKSTTSTLIHAILSEAGWNARLVGNVGTPVVAELEGAILDADERRDDRMLVVEASSYQLEACSVLKPKVGVFLNLSDNHLERHGTMDRYFEAKCRLFAKQDEHDLAVSNFDDPRGRNVSLRTAARSAFFGRASSELERCGVPYAEILPDGRTIVFGEERYDLGSARLLGLHNRYNAAAAIIAARECGVEQEVIERVLNAFEPLEHRLEVLCDGGSWEAVRPLFVNDSKSTTVAASVAALSCIRERFPDRSVTLMIGGLAKAGSWEPLMKALKGDLPSLGPVVCFGRDAPLLANHCRAAAIPAVTSRTLRDAVDGIQAQPQNYDIVLFSPGCASFDEFVDFEERGCVFKSLVKVAPST